MMLRGVLEMRTPIPPKYERLPVYSDPCEDDNPCMLFSLTEYNQPQCKMRTRSVTVNSSSLLGLTRVPQCH